MAVMRIARNWGRLLAAMGLMLMLGASAAFATPIGYQTNLMVLSRGGYRFFDFTFIGAILTIFVGVVINTDIVIVRLFVILPLSMSCRKHRI